MWIFVANWLSKWVELKKGVKLNIATEGETIRYKKKKEYDMKPLQNYNTQKFNSKGG